MVMTSSLRRPLLSLYPNNNRQCSSFHYACYSTTRLQQQQQQQQQQPLLFNNDSQQETVTTTKTTTATATTNIPTSTLHSASSSTAEQIKQMISQFQHLMKQLQIPIQLQDKEEQEQLAIVVLNLRPETKFESRKCMFMGQNVLSMCCADYLYSHFPNMNGEQLQAVLQQFCRRQNMVEVARDLKLNTIFSPQQEHVDIDVIDDQSLDVDARGHEFVVSSTMLRLIGAIYFVNGLHVVRQFIASRILSKSVDITSLLESFDPKKDLVEMIRSGEMKEYANEQLSFDSVPRTPQQLQQQQQKQKAAAAAAKNYKPQRQQQQQQQASVMDFMDDSSADLITVHVKVKDQVLGVGSGHTKKIADMRAAQDALNRFYTKYNKALTPIQLEQRLLFGGSSSGSNGKRAPSSTPSP